MRGMLYMRCRCEQLLSASRKRLEAARIWAFAARISTFAEHHLEEVLARDNSLRRGDGRWRGHHSVDPSERRTERTFGSTGPGRAELERAGANLDHFGEEIRFENDSVLLPMALQWRASSQRAPNRRKLLERPGQFRRIYKYSHYYFVVFFALNYIGTPPI